MTKVLKSAKTLVLPPPEPPKIIEKKMNKYDLVDHLVPQVTDLAEDFMQIMCQGSVVNSPEFLSVVEKIRSGDPQTI